MNAAIKSLLPVFIVALFAVVFALGVFSYTNAWTGASGGTGVSTGTCCSSSGTGSTGVGQGSGPHTPPPPHYSAPTCSLSVSPSQVSYGGSDTISWSTSNATSISLSGWGSVSANGSQTDSNITSGKTYTLTASGKGGTVTCTKTVTVKIQQCPANYTGTYPNCVPITCPSGYTGSYPNCVPITCPSGYTGTYPSCVPPPTYNYPSCNIYINNTYNQNYSYNQYNTYGQPIVINWNSQYATYGYINNGVGSVNISGSQTVYPTQSTTYTGTFYGQNGQTVTCSVTVNINTYIPPIVNPPVVYQNPAPYITLSAVPYTGLDLSPAGTVMYWGFLVLWCLGAAYLIAIKRVHMKIYHWYKESLFGEDAPHAVHAHTAHVSHAVAAPVAHIETAPTMDVEGVDSFILSQIHRTKRA